MTGSWKGTGGSPQPRHDADYVQREDEHHQPQDRLAHPHAEGDERVLRQLWPAVMAKERHVAEQRDPDHARPSEEQVGREADEGDGRGRLAEGERAF